MNAIDSGQPNERAAPDLSFLERSPTRPPSIPNATGAGRDNAADGRPRRGDGKVLKIGHGITVSGEISACDTLVVEGMVEANLTSGRSLEIARGGVYRGNAGVDSATIAGTFEGDLTVSGQLQIAASGRVRGTVRYGRLEIESGGELNGDISVSATGR